MPTTSSRWPCDNCGAVMTWDPKSGMLSCGHCGNEKPLPERAASDRNAALIEHDLEAALRNRLPPEAMEVQQVTRCPGCGAELELEEQVRATRCPFCATPVMPSGETQRLIKPQALVPFAIPERDARAAMTKWLGKLWFAPNGLQEFAKKGRQLTGIYVPFWTFDAATRSRYSGQRGDAYYVTRTVTVMVEGRPQQRQEQVRQIRWTAVSGQVGRNFDDVLTIGSTSLPQSHTEALQPWDLSTLEPATQGYLAGFQAEAYSVPLDAAHQRARAMMADQIAMDVRRDIGGDEQRIGQIQTQWMQETFKHILLPVWTAAYKYGGKSYSYVVNGQTGKVKGERPYSAWKIAFAVLLGLVVLAAFGLVSGELR